MTEGKTHVFHSTLMPTGTHRGRSGQSIVCKSLVSGELHLLGPHMIPLAFDSPDHTVGEMGITGFWRTRMQGTVSRTCLCDAMGKFIR